MPIVTYIILAVTCIVSFQAYNDRMLNHKLAFYPYAINRDRQWYRFFTHALVHSPDPGMFYIHLFFNMYALYLFGAQAEVIKGVHGLEGLFGYLFGHVKGMFFYALLYIGAIMISSFPSFEKHKNNPHYSAVGASGAVSAVLFAYMLIVPTGGIGFMFLPFYIPGFVFGPLYLIFSWQMAKRGSDNIGHDAHFWGAVFGVVFTAALKISLVTDFVVKVRVYIDQLLHHS